MRNLLNLLPIFRSAAQAKILATLFLQADPDGLPLKRLAEASGVALSQAHRETKRLEEAGIAVSERVGNVRLVRPNRSSPFYRELAVLVAKAFGPVPVLRELLGGVQGIESAYLFGSWAERYAGRAGPAPADVDVIIVGRPETEAVYEAARVAEGRLGREVNPTIVSSRDWNARRSGFLRTVRSRPLVAVLGEEA